MVYQYSEKVEREDDEGYSIVGWFTDDVTPLEKQNCDQIYKIVGKSMDVVNLDFGEVFLLVLVRPFQSSVSVYQETK